MREAIGANAAVGVSRRARREEENFMVVVCCVKIYKSLGAIGRALSLNSVHRYL